jgi:hypothetical protein
MLGINLSAIAANVKYCQFSGSFYPAEEQVLRKTIEDYLASADLPKIPGKILGVIAPHAGYQYSASVAAYSYKAIAATGAQTVILMGPSHKYQFNGIASYSQGEFSTPLGNLVIDKQVNQGLQELDFVKQQTRAFSGEHCLEVQLPFLKTVLPQAKIVPLIFGKVNREQINQLAQAIKSIAIDKKILVVVSTDLSHYHRYSEARSKDAKTISDIVGKDTQGLWRGVYQQKRCACGILPLIAFIDYVKLHKGKISKLHYANSGDTAGNKQSVVGYLSAVGYVDEGKQKQGVDMGLTDADKKKLLEMARTTLEHKLNGEQLPEFEAGSPVLKEKRAVFVTLKKNGQLRGCIGRIVADLPLYKVVPKQVLQAALEDPRFPALEPQEVPEIEIEISVMTPFEEVKDLSTIKVGKHGLMLYKGFHSGLLLPQVPVEQNWDRQTFLEHLSLKAGLNKDAYKQDAVIYKFSAEVFSESQFD